MAVLARQRGESFRVAWPPECAAVGGRAHVVGQRWLQRCCRRLRYDNLFDTDHVLAAITGMLGFNEERKIIMYKTERHGTRTLQGWMPHLRRASPYGALQCPVRVEIDRRYTDQLPLPCYDRDGNLRYVLPGGGDVVA